MTIQSLIPDPTVTYDGQGSTGTLKFTPVADQSGTATITVTVEDGGLDNDLGTPEDNGVINRTVTVITEAVNDAPTLDALSDVNINEDDLEQTVNLTGITAGGSETQVLLITAVSDNTGLIPDPTVDFDGQSSTAILKFTPVADQSGTATITVTVTDGGLDNDLATPEDNGVINRTVTVITEAVNDEPTLDVLSDVNITEDAPEYTVNLTGIAAGGSELQVLSVTAVSDNTGLIPDPTVVFDGQSSTGTLTFTPVADQSGTATITVTVEDGGLDNNLGTLEDNGIINRTIVVRSEAVNDAPTGNVTVDGIAEEGQLLTTTNDLADIDGLGVIAYEWSLDGDLISGATASTYTLTQDDVGSTITATARYTDNDGTVETVTSSATSAVLNVNDAPTGDVTIDGSATQNAVLSANTSTVQDEDGLGAFTYQWLRDGVPIAAGTSSTYTLTQADVDSQISVQVDYTDNQSTAESLTSAQTSAVVNVNDAPVLGGNRTIHYPDFSDTTGLILEGRAAQYGDILRVHDNTRNTNGVIEFDAPVQVLDGFETDFAFRVGDEMTSSGADNLAFAMYGRDGQTTDPWARHSLHFMIDTWNNPEHEFDQNNWSLQIIGQSPDLVPNSAKGGYVFHVVPLPGVKDTELHDVQIAYDPKVDSLVVTFDDVEILSTDSQEIGSFLQTLLEQVDAGVSIWASSGGVSETHDIHSWSFTSLTPPALNAVVEGCWRSCRCWGHSC